MDKDKSQVSFASLLGEFEAIKRKSSLNKPSINQIKLETFSKPVKKTQDKKIQINKKLVSKQIKTDTQIEFKVLNAKSRLEERDSSVNHKQMRALKAGKLKIRNQLDLHGLTKNEAEESVNELINHSSKCVVLIIHGKGHNSQNPNATLKTWLNSYLKHHPRVRAFCSAQIKDGGTGAAYVLLN